MDFTAALNNNNFIIVKLIRMFNNKFHNKIIILIKKQI